MKNQIIPNTPTICHIISGDLWAGAEAMAFNLISAQKEQGDCIVCAVVFNHGRLAAQLERCGVEVAVISEQEHLFVQLVIKTVAFVKKKKVFALHSHRYKENLVAFLVSLTMPGVRLFATQHGMPEDNRSTNLLRRMFTRDCFMLLSLFFRKTVVVSDDMQRLLAVHYGFNTNRIAVVHNGIVLPRFDTLQKVMRPFVVGASGRLFPVKDFFLFVEIARELKNFSNISFVIAGDGPLRSALEDKIRVYGIDKSVTLLGNVEDVDSFYNSLQVFMNTSVHEGIPMTILEAMGNGLPVVAPHIGGIPEIIVHEEQGFLVQSRNPADFAQYLRTLFTDHTLYRTMAASARRRIETAFSAKAMARGYTELYIV